MIPTDYLGSSNDDGDSDESSGESQEVEGDYKTFSNWITLMNPYIGAYILDQSNAVPPI